MEVEQERFGAKKNEYRRGRIHKAQERQRAESHRLTTHGISRKSNRQYGRFGQQRIVVFCLTIRDGHTDPPQFWDCPGVLWLCP